MTLVSCAIFLLILRCKSGNPLSPRPLPLPFALPCAIVVPPAVPSVQPGPARNSSHPRAKAPQLLGLRARYRYLRYEDLASKIRVGVIEHLLIGSY